MHENIFVTRNQSRGSRVSVCQRRPPPPILRWTASFPRDAIKGPSSTPPGDWGFCFPRNKITDVSRLVQLLYRGLRWERSGGLGSIVVILPAARRLNCGRRSRAAFTINLSRPFEHQGSLSLRPHFRAGTRSPHATVNLMLHKNGGFSHGNKDCASGPVRRGGVAGNGVHIRNPAARARHAFVQE